MTKIAQCRFCGKRGLKKKIIEHEIDKHAMEIKNEENKDFN
jgi:NADH pyrophosphatase NudC (nudix superfamily)